MASRTAVSRRIREQVRDMSVAYAANRQGDFATSSAAAKASYYEGYIAGYVHAKRIGEELLARSRIVQPGNKRPLIHWTSIDDQPFSASGG